MLTDQDFRDKFEKQFPGYTGRLKNTFPEITNTELRLFIFIKVGLENTEIANITGISTESLYRSRYRLRRKLNLDPDASLEWFVKNF